MIRFQFRFLAATGALLYICLSVGSYAQEVTNAAAQLVPQIVCVQPSYDFGKADSGQVIEHTFEVRNSGQTSLEITRVKPSCGCTVANLSRKIVPPNETAEITTRLNLRGRSGRQRKHITVESNDPQNPGLRLTLEGDVINELEVRPNRIFYGQIQSTNPITRAIEIISQSETPLNITDIIVSHPQIETALETLQEGKHFRLQVVLNPAGLTEPVLRGTIRLRTDSPRYPDINVEVSGMIVGALIVAPEKIVLQKRNDQPLVRYAVIRGGQTKDFKITEVIPPDSNIVVNTMAMGDQGYRIQISNIPASEEMTGKKLIIGTDVPEKKIIEIPFEFRP
ncbi:MAG: DUF1573 domain-containing protein [Verrucomicrobia bacterium]|nr:DUF1573 domain-containing protein [Verrucomicrobiota bacterium]